jgi:hypothetical protein
MTELRQTTSFLALKMAVISTLKLVHRNLGIIYAKKLV